jgi:translation elongation factor EF-G
MNGFQNVTSQGRVRFVMGNNRLAITLRCFPLPKSVMTHLDPEKADRLSLLKKFLEKKDNYQVLHSSDPEDCHWNEFPVDERFYKYWNGIIQSITPSSSESLDEDLANRIDSSLHSSSSSLSTAFGELNGFDLFLRLMCLGPNGCGPNLLLLSPDCCIDIMRDLVQISMIVAEGESETIVPGEVETSIDRRHNDITFLQIFTRVKSAIMTGFQFASINGPLMAEPLYGVGFTIEKIEISRQSCGLAFDEFAGGLPLSSSSVDTSAAVELQTAATSLSSIISMGQLISDVKDNMKICLLSANIRLVEPVYKCNIQCDQSQLGNLYSVLSKRRGDVIGEDIIEGTTFFILTVVLPVIDSFGFSQELLKKTSGSATAPQLFFSHWEILNEDPFWKPTTAEELEDLGEVVHEANLPRQRIDAVRRRKGLVVEEKIVIHAEKQRTLTRNK